jgi:ADP-dependent phosphofructokinase/glucokinase
MEVSREEMLEFAKMATFQIDDRLCPFSREDLRAEAWLEGYEFAKRHHKKESEPTELQWAGNLEDELAALKREYDMEPHVERMLVEERELREKIQKLAEFITNNPIFGKLSEDEQADMKSQLAAMSIYADILSKRIERVVPMPLQIMQDKLTDLASLYLKRGEEFDENGDIDISFGFEDGDKAYDVTFQVIETKPLES